MWRFKLIVKICLIYAVITASILGFSEIMGHASTTFTCKSSLGEMKFELVITKPKHADELSCVYGSGLVRVISIDEDDRFRIHTQAKYTSSTSIGYGVTFIPLASEYRVEVRRLVSNLDLTVNMYIPLDVWDERGLSEDHFKVELNHFMWLPFGYYIDAKYK